MEVHLLWKEEALWMLELSYLGQLTTLEFLEINALNSV
jgi:hypothetical protein